MTTRGEIVFAGWGRCDMGQLPTETSSQEGEEIIKFIRSPITISTPALCEGPFVEMWCGSEYTLALTESGELWSRGWREHGNLGHDLVENPEISSSHVCYQWVPVKREVSINQTTTHPFTLKSSWTGKVACGGAHCLVLLDL